MLCSPRRPVPRCDRTTDDMPHPAGRDSPASSASCCSTGALVPVLQRAAARLRTGQPALAGKGIRVAAMSVDDREATAALVEKHKLTSRSAAVPTPARGRS